MNDRIRELARQAGYSPLEPRAFADDLREVFLQKFAELIILDAKCWIHKRVGPKTALDFLEHFGVKE